jgi:hypothetical protein
MPAKTGGLPRRAKVGIPNKSVDIDPNTYFIAKRMETAGMLRPGQALMLAATLPNTKKPQSRGKSATAKGKRK